MNPPDRVRLQHLADALSSAVRFIRGRERADLDTDEMLLFALVRAVEIAGEAASQVTAETRAQLPDLPWNSMVGMRNRLVHAYFRHQSRYPVDHRHRNISSVDRAAQNCSRGGWRTVTVTRRLAAILPADVAGYSRPIEADEEGYVLEGSVRKAGQRVRITAQLIDAQSGTHLWADRFDGSLEDILDLQNKIAISVAGVIEPALQAAETARSANRPTNDLTAYDLYLRAYAMASSSAARFPEALALLQQAIERDPGDGPALAYASVCCLRLCMDARTSEPESAKRKGIEFARRALRVASDNPAVLAEAAVVLGFFGEDIDAMTALADRVLALNPSYARGWYLSAILRLWASDLERAIEHAETSLRLSPRARVGWNLMTLGSALFLSFDEAVPKLLLQIQDDPTNQGTYRLLVACYAHMGKLDEARKVIERLQAITSVVIPDARFLRNPEHRELFLSGLRLAAGET
jgi:uncharacterized protein with HEPN domain/tetratricopeptide (TPR) repeat protein